MIGPKTLPPKAKNQGNNYNDLQMLESNLTGLPIRAVVRNRIEEILRNHPTFHELNHVMLAKVAGIFDETILVEAPSQNHYMDISTLESRVENLIDVCPYSSNRSMKRKREATSNTSYNNVSSASGGSTITPTENSQFNSLKFGGGPATSRRFLPNGHHRVIASAHTDSPGTNMQTVPMASENYIDDRSSQMNGYFNDGQSSDISTAQDDYNLMYGSTFYSFENMIMHLPLSASSCNLNNARQQNTLYPEQKNIGVSNRIPDQLHNHSDRSSAKCYQKYLVETFRAQSILNDQSLAKSGLTPNQMEIVTHQICSESSSGIDRWEKTKKKFQNLRRKILILYHHAFYCSDSGGKCMYPRCMDMKALIVHSSDCAGDCSKRSCTQLKEILAHYQECQNSKCIVCISVKENLKNNLQEKFSSNASGTLASLFTVNSMEKCEPPLVHTGNGTSLVSLHVKDSQDSIPTVNVLDNNEPPLKSAKDITTLVSLPVEDSPDSTTTCITTTTTTTTTTTVDEIHKKKAQLKNAKNDSSLVSAKIYLNHNPTAVNGMEDQEPPKKCAKHGTTLDFLAVKDSLDSISKVKSEECKAFSTPLNCEPGSMELNEVPKSSSSQDSKTKTKILERLLDNETIFEVRDAHPKMVRTHVTVEADEVKLEICASTAKAGVHLEDQVSIIDLLTFEETKDHLNSLRASNGQISEKAIEIQRKRSKEEKDTCSLCGMQKLFFEPPAQYCAACYKIIPKGIYYYTANESDSYTLFCRNCIHASGGNIIIGDNCISKATLMKGQSNAETTAPEEWWVACDKCNAWMHQICALFNPEKQTGEIIITFTCPDCLIQEIDSGERNQIIQSKIPRAKDLQTTKLSDHLEKWISRRLEEERRERADFQGKKFTEVPTAEGLVIRVVSSVTKKVEVKKAVQDIIKETTYPSGFSYKSKAIVLFQNIDGVDVCLFGMYVQEYGSKCADPNKKRCCISYIDSVKHFKPDIKTTSGVALRTFVYHEIILGYCDYNKKLGFINCYIWACPPLKRDNDYILYCHPKLQKMPKHDKLREWYQTMIQKGLKTKIIVERTNLYDYFFVKNIECKATITAARLPYFDGDYWPGLAEELLLENLCRSKPRKKGGNAKTERVLRAYRRESITGNEQDILFMYNLGQKIRPLKEDFIMIYLHHVCKHCCHPILSGNAWICSACKSFQLCEKCFQLQQKMEKKDKHPSGKNEEHVFHKVGIDKIQEDTVDDEEIIQNEIFDTRLAFLGFCQNKHYQFDTLRRAKHSTMMILYSLHKPHLHEHEVACSVHNLQLNNQNKQIRTVQDLSGAPLLHASGCHACNCTYPFCRKLKGFFGHSAKCKIRMVGGCKNCRKIWIIIRTHAQSCVQLECSVPRCKDMKEWMRKKQTIVSHSEQRAEGKERMKVRIKMQKNR